METYSSAAAQGFARLATLYTQPGIFGGNFWFGGNSLQTCLDYMVFAHVEDTQKILPAAYDIYRSMASNSGWWHDDYGWWGNAFVTAINNRGALGYGASSYDAWFDAIGGAAECCWRSVNSDWSIAAYGSTPRDNAAGSANITGGTYNVPVSLDQPPMQGRNSVTNEGYWLLSLGLAGLNPGKDWFATGAADIQTWFQAWIARGRGTAGILNPNGLALERPMGNAALPTWYWSGDQGLLMQALFGSNADQRTAFDMAKAVIAQMTDTQGILHENLGFMSLPSLSGFEADYATGKGILMRGLLDINLNTGRPFDQFIKVNATSVWNFRDKSTPPQFVYNWDMNLLPGYESPRLDVPAKGQPLCNLIMQAAGQDALNAAMRLDPDGVISGS